jgi:hypothetical protein
MPNRQHRPVAHQVQLAHARALVAHAYFIRIGVECRSASQRARRARVGGTRVRPLHPHAVHRAAEAGATRVERAWSNRKCACQGACMRACARACVLRTACACGPARSRCVAPTSACSRGVRLRAEPDGRWRTSAGAARHSSAGRRRGRKAVCLFARLFVCVGAAAQRRSAAALSPPTGGGAGRKTA